MNIHISLLGRAIDPILKAFQYYPMDKLYILHSEDNQDFAFAKTAENLKKKLSEVGFSSVILKQIDPFDMNCIIGAIMQIAETEKGATFYVNITGGTNLMAGASCSASFFIGAKAYYILNQSKLSEQTNIKDQVLELPIPKVPNAISLQKTQRSILVKINNHKGRISSRMLRKEMDIAPQKLSYHLKELEEKGLLTTHRGLETDRIVHGKIVRKIDTRILMVALTNVGKMVAEWTKT